MRNNHDPKITPWHIREQDFPREGSSTDKFEFLLHYAILAPSGHNSQPWKFSVGEDEIQVLADKTRWSKGIDPHQRELHMAVGCALENLLVAAEHFGFGHQVTYFPKPDQEDLVATVKFTLQAQPSPARDSALFHAISTRHTNRKVYEGRSISKEDIDHLQNCCTLKASAPARIINVGASAHQFARRVNFDDLQGQTKYSGWGAYAQSKLCNLLFTSELARRLEGTGVTVNALHPGVVATQFGHNNPGLMGRLIRLSNLIAISPERGAQTVIYLATSPDVEGVTGKYFVKSKAVPSSRASYDQVAATRLWQVSAELTGLPT